MTTIKTENLKTFLEIIDALNPEINPERILVDNEGELWEAKEEGLATVIMNDKYTGVRRQSIPFEEFGSCWFPFRLPAPSERAKYLLEKGHMVQSGPEGDIFRYIDGCLCIRRNDQFTASAYNLNLVFNAHRYVIDLGPYMESIPERVLTPDNFVAEITKLESVELWQDKGYMYELDANYALDRQQIHIVVHHGEELHQELRNYVWKEGE